jgi:hypothetical protein
MARVHQRADLLTELADIKRRLRVVEGTNGLNSAKITQGGLTIENDAYFQMISPAGVFIVYIGPDGLGGQTLQIRRADGTLVLDTQRDVASGHDFWAFWDRAGHIVLSDDVQAGKGLAKPWLSVPMNPLFSMTANTVWSYMNLPVASVTTETTLWEGRIPLATHPKIQVNGIWGTASGSNTSTYKLYVDGTAVGTWSETGIDAGVKGPFDITSVYDRTDLVVQVRVTASGTGNVACHVHNIAMRQS